MFSGGVDEALVFVSQPGRFQLEGLRFRRVGSGVDEIAFDLAPHSEDNLAFSLVRHACPS
jgi:hypothetical protein